MAITFGKYFVDVGVCCIGLAGVVGGLGKLRFHLEEDLVVVPQAGSSTLKYQYSHSLVNPLLECVPKS